MKILANKIIILHLAKSQENQGYLCYFYD